MRRRFSLPSRILGTRAGRAASGARPTRRPGRLVLLLLAISVGWKVALFGVGGAVVTLALDDGIAAVPTDLRPYGAQARETARALWTGPIERRGIREIRLLTVEREHDGAASACGGLTARVRAYTFFAIPYSEVRTICDRGTVEYRGLPHRRRATP